MGVDRAVLVPSHGTASESSLVVRAGIRESFHSVCYGLRYLQGVAKERPKAAVLYRRLFAKSETGEVIILPRRQVRQRKQERRGSRMKSIKASTVCGRKEEYIYFLEGRPR